MLEYFSVEEYHPLQRHAGECICPQSVNTATEMNVNPVTVVQNLRGALGMGHLSRCFLSKKHFSDVAVLILAVLSTSSQSY